MFLQEVVDKHLVANLTARLKYNSNSLKRMRSYTISQYYFMRDEQRNHQYNLDELNV